MAALFAFGILHLLLGWNGDILHIYAVLGLVIAAIMWIPRPAILTLVVFLSFWPATLATYRSHTTTPADRASRQKAIRARMAGLSSAGNYRDVSYVRAVDQRVQYAKFAYSEFVATATAYSYSGAAALLGVWFARKRWLQEAGAHRQTWRRIAFTGAIGGFILK
jgi:uncharacterized protein